MMPEEQERITITVGMTTAMITLSLLGREIIKWDAEGTLHPHVAKFYLTALAAMEDEELPTTATSTFWWARVAKSRCEERLDAATNDEEEY